MARSGGAVAAGVLGVCGLVLFVAWAISAPGTFTAFRGTPPPAVEAAVTPTSFEVRVAAPTWTAERVVQRLTAVHQQMAAAMEAAHDHEGGSGQIAAQTTDYLQLAVDTHAKTVCEIGVNGGQSSATWLLGSAPWVRRLVLFDLGAHSYVVPATLALKRLATEAVALAAPPSAGAQCEPPRVDVAVNLGDSTKTVPAYHAANPDVVCDLWHVDGGHMDGVPAKDLASALAMSREGTVIILDDVNAACTAPDLKWSGCWEPSTEWDRLVAAGIIKETHRAIEAGSQYRGWVWGTVTAKGAPAPAAE